MKKNATVTGTLSAIFTLSAMLLITPYLITAYAQEGYEVKLFPRLTGIQAT
jgi:hypothetical protein